jgi:RNA polymerase sigma-70 factor (ECF subfamily)
MSRPEAALLERAKRFDFDVLAEIYDRYSPGLYRYAMRLLGNSDTAEDCVAETFSRFLHVLQGGRGPDTHLQAYLYRVAHNWITDYYRRQPPPPLSLDLVLQLPADSNPVREAMARMQAEQVRAALTLLTPDQRQVVVLKFFHGWKNEQVAAALEKPVGAVKSLQHRAINALRRILITLEAEDYETIS